MTDFPKDIVVFDMEWTAWEGSWQRRWSNPGEHREVVQIGAVRLCPRTLAETGSMLRLVKPRVNPVLSDYFKDLTGIDQAEVDRDGIALAEAMGEFGRFVVGAGAIYSNGPDEEVLRENCTLIGLDYPLGWAPFVDVHDRLVARMQVDSRAVVSSALPSMLGLAGQGRSHDALADARALMSALIHLDLLQPVAA